MAQLRFRIQQVLVRPAKHHFRNRRLLCQARILSHEAGDQSQALEKFRQKLTAKSEKKHFKKPKTRNNQDAAEEHLTVEEFDRLLAATQGKDVLTEELLGTIISSMTKKSEELDDRVIKFVLHEMEPMFGFRGNAYMFSILMQATRRNLSKTTEIWKEMQSKGISPSWGCYDAFIWSHIGAKKNEEAREIFEDFKEKERLGIGMYTTGMQIYMRLKEFSLARELYKEMRFAHITPDKESCLLAIQASIREGDMTRALQPYFEAVSLGIGPTTAQANALLEAILDECSNDPRLAETALRIFDQAHYKSKVLTEQSFKVLVEIFHRVDRKLTMDMIYVEARKHGFLDPWSTGEDNTIDVSEMSHAVARTSIRHVLNEHVRAYHNFVDQKSKASLPSDSDSDESDTEDIQAQNVVSSDALVLSDFGRFFGDIYLRVNKFNLEHVESVVHSFHTKLKTEKVKGDRNLLRIRGSKLEEWLKLAKKPTNQQRFEL